MPLFNDRKPLDMSYSESHRISVRVLLWVRIAGIQLSKLGPKLQSNMKRSQACMGVVQPWKALAGGEGERLLLWVLDGLAGVVISAVPNNVVGSKLLSSPRAVLWGEHQGLLSWPPSSGGALQPSCAAARSPGWMSRSKLTCLVACNPKAPSREEARQQEANRGWFGTSFVRQNGHGFGLAMSCKDHAKALGLH